MGEETTGQGEDDLEGQPAAFNLASEAYGVDTGIARESSHVPDAPEFVEGVIDLPDNVIPVNDLRKQVHLSMGEGTKSTPYRRRGHRRRGHRGHRPRRDRGYAGGRRRDRSGFDDGYDYDYN